MDREEEGDEQLLEALQEPLVTADQIYQFGHTLIDEGLGDKAMMVFELNRERFPDDNFTTYLGLAHGYELLGKHKQAIKHYRLAAENAPEGQQDYYLSLALALEP